MGKPPPLPPRRDRTTFADPPQPPDPPKPPPLPADYLAAHAALRAIPVDPAPVDYGIARYPVIKPASTRPGAVTAIGVISLILGAVGMLGSMLEILPISQVYSPAMAGRTAPTNPAPTLPRSSTVGVRAPVTIAPYTGDLQGAEGLGRAEAYAAVAAVDAKMRLNVDRRTTLRRLVGEFGAVVFPRRGPTLTFDAASAAIRETGQLPAGPDGLRARGTQFFRTESGAVLLDDMTAQFVPTPRGPTRRVDDDVATDASGAHHRCATVVAEEIDRVRERLGPSFTPTQAAGLAAHRRAPLPDGGPGAEAGRGMIEVALPGEGAKMIGPAAQVDGNTYVLADGRVVTSVFGVDATTGLPTQGPVLSAPAPAPTGMSNPGPIPGATFRASTGRWMILTSALEALLGVLLIVAGGLVLRDAPSAMSLHLRYATLKLAVTVVGLWSTARFLEELPSAGPPVAASSPGSAWAMAMTDPAVVWTSILVGTAMAVAYPVALLLAARHPTVRGYYASRGGELRVLPAAWRRRGQAYVEWLRRRKGRAAAGGLGGLALLIALTQGSLVLGAGPGERFGHVQTGLACGVVGAMCLYVAARSRKVAAATLATAALLLVSVAPLSRAQGATTRPSGPTTRAKPLDLNFLLGTSISAGGKVRHLPTDPAERRAAVVELLHRGQGLRYFKPWPTYEARVNEERRRAQPAWDMLMELARTRDPALLELLDAPDPDVRREAVWATQEVDVALLPDPALRAPFIRAIPRLVELIGDADVRVAEIAGRHLGRIGSAGWAPVFALLGNDDPALRARAVHVVVQDRRTQIGPAERKALEDHADELLRQLREPVRNQGAALQDVRIVLRRLQGSPALAASLARLEREDPSAYQTVTRRLAQRWTPSMEPESRTAASAAPANTTPPETAPRSAPGASARVARPASGGGGGTSVPDLAARLVANPRAADSMDAKSVEAAAALICRRGPAFFADLARQAVTGDGEAAGRARRLLEIAATTRPTGPLAQPSPASLSDLDRRVGFDVAYLLGRSPGSETILIGELWPRLFRDGGYDDPSRVTGWVRVNAVALRPGPETREAVRRARLSRPMPDLRELESRPADRVAPPILSWETAAPLATTPPPARPGGSAAPPPAGKRLPVGDILDVLSPVVLLLGGAGCAAYLLVRPAREDAPNPVRPTPELR